MAANSAVVKAFWIRLFAWLCLAFLLTAALLQLRPCLPKRSTVVLPHMQGCGRQIGAPILSAQAILKLELLSLRPREVTGYALSQSLACLADTALRRAKSVSDVPLRRPKVAILKPQIPAVDSAICYYGNMSD